jgi:glycosyltransferase involved in cell wall biosynthesis
MTHTSSLLTLSSSVILTVKNDAAGCAQTLESLVGQSRLPDEVVVVDGGSSDDTRRRIAGFADRLPGLRFIDSPGANIARGREIATQQARGPIIASIDAGCRADRDWLKNLVDPFERDPDVDVVAGVYEVEPHSLFERVVGLATMRGQLSPFDPATFHPSGRSLAYTKDAWRRAGGWPTWLRYSEDTLFAHKLRRIARGWRFAGDAVVHWRPRTTFWSLARQFYGYGTGRGHTQIGAADFHYNLRNLALVLLSLAGCRVSGWFALLTLALAGYFYVVTFLPKARIIAHRTRTWRAYPLTLLILWVVMFANLAGYLCGSWQRRMQSDRFRVPMEAYRAAG